METIHKFIRARRKSLDFTHDKAAQLIGVSRSTYSRYEYGQHIPLDKLELMAKVFFSIKLHEFMKLYHDKKEG